MRTPCHKDANYTAGGKNKGAFKFMMCKWTNANKAALSVRKIKSDERVRSVIVNKCLTLA